MYQCAENCKVVMYGTHMGSTHARRSHDLFYFRGPPGRRHPVLDQSCTRVKLLRAAGDL